MKILLSCPNDGQTNNFILNGLQSLGHECYFIDHRVNIDQAYQFAESFIAEEQIDLMLVLHLVNTQTYSVKMIEDLKYKNPQTKYAAWHLDTRIVEHSPEGGSIHFVKDFLPFTKLVGVYDYFFTISREIRDSLRMSGVNAHLLNEGYDEFAPIFDLPKIYDVSFIGQFGHGLINKDRFPYLEKISKICKLKLFGSYLSGKQSLMPFYAKRQTYNSVDHSYIVAQTHINWSLGIKAEALDTFSARGYRILGAGGFLLHNRTELLEEYFVDGKHLAMYDGVDECLDKIDFYLKNPDLMKDIAAQGQLLVSQKYKFSDSMTTMLDIIAGRHE